MSGNEINCGLSSHNTYETDKSVIPSKGCLRKFVDCYSESSSSESQDEQCPVSNQYIPITPFNMKEELEEGYFDCNGTYHLKENRTNNDYWLESISWSTNKNFKFHKHLSNDSSDSESDETFNDIYKKIITYLKPKETVAKAICRLGKNTLTAAERLKLKKLGKNISFNNRKSRKVTDLTGLADYILNKTGNVDIYQETFEQLVDRITNFEKENKEVTSHQSLVVKCKQPQLDMFSDHFDE